MSEYSNHGANDQASRVLRLVREQLGQATAAPKCHGCGCLQQTVEALEATAAGRDELAAVLAQARAVFLPKKYDCLGCEVCYPANAANAFGDAFPSEGRSLDLCPTESPGERKGWPPLPGEYHVVRYRAPVAVCTLNDDALAERLAARPPDGLAIAGALHTENLGIERIIRNVTANPHLRRLVVCGDDARQAVGHLPGQSLVSLFVNGVDENGRIRGARGRRPVLKNVTSGQIEAFRRQVELVPRIGDSDAEAISEAVRREVDRAPGPFDGTTVEAAIEPIPAPDPQTLVLDPAGYCVVYPDRARGCLLLEHYTNSGVLDCVLEGATPAALYVAATERRLVSRLDHAAYLGRELARAERSLMTGEPYVQDRAAGVLAVDSQAGTSACACGPKETT